MFVWLVTSIVGASIIRNNNMFENFSIPLCCAPPHSVETLSGSEYDSDTAVEVHVALPADDSREAGAMASSAPLSETLKLSDLRMVSARRRALALCVFVSIVCLAKFHSECSA